MIIILKPGHTPADVALVEERVRDLGYDPHTIRGEVRTVVAAVGDESIKASLESLLGLDMVEKVLPVQKRYKLISRETHPETGLFSVRGLEIGGQAVRVIAGPCSIENRGQLVDTVRRVKAAGATMMRGGAYKPRTSPYAFQGLGEKGLRMAQDVSRETGMPLVSEVLRESDLPLLVEHVDILQIGARNALNYALLEAAASSGHPVLLKRGMASTVEEWLLAAEYMVRRGNRRIILCERGIRTYETATRNTLDLSAVAIAKKETCLPVFVDPSHAAGRWDLVSDLSRAAIAVGADGLMIEVHPHPEKALSDGAQQLTPEAFERLMEGLAPFARAAGRTLG